MAGRHERWAPYVPVAERRRKAERAMARLRKTGHAVAPVTVSGRSIATTFWGRAWCDNMESYHDYENRLPRGRTYVRNGSVVDLQVESGRVTAVVSGSELYKVTISIKEAAKAHWQAMCADCAGGIDSLVELLQGRFSKGVMERLCRQAGGLFPQPSDIRFSCTCPDHALMCKHVAAVFYGVGARLDQQPELLFRLRAVDEADLVTGLDVALPLAKTGPAAGKVLAADDVSALFGLDMMAPEPPTTGTPPAPAGAAPVRRRQPVSKDVVAAPDVDAPRKEAPQRASAGTRATRSAPTRKATVAGEAPAKPTAPKPEPGVRPTPIRPVAPKPRAGARASSRPAGSKRAVAAPADGTGKTVARTPARVRARRTQTGEPSGR